MKRYYGVKSVFYNDGTCYAKLIPAVDANELPKNTCVEGENYSTYIDWFDDFFEAKAYVEDCKKQNN